MAVRQWVVVFPKRVRYFLNIDAGCLNRVAGIAMHEVQRHSGNGYKHCARSAERRGVICAPLRGGAECAFALVIGIAAGEF